MSAIQIIGMVIIAVGSASGYIILMVRESGAALQDIEDYEEDEPY